MSTSRLEALFLLVLRGYGLPEPVREYRFHPERRFRFDFAYPERKIALEVEGGIWSAGRHTRGAGFRDDCIKYNAAAALGWQVFRYPRELFKNVYADIGQVIRATKGSIKIPGIEMFSKRV